MKKPAFISSLGRHSINSLGKDLYLEALLKLHDQVKNEGLNSNHFKNLSKNMSYSDLLMRNGLKIGTSLLLKTLESNDLQSIHPDKKLSFTQTNLNRFARSRIFNKVTVHYGSETSGRIINYQKTPNVEIQNKTIFDTEAIMSPSKRKSLNLKSGFNQKNYSFIPNKFGFSRKKFAEIHKKSLEQVRRSRNNLKQVYSCSYYIKNRLKIFNNDKDFNANIEIFLFHIKNRLTPSQLLELSFKTRKNEGNFREKIAGLTGFFPEEQQINVLPYLNSDLNEIINVKTTLSSDIFTESEFMKNNLQLIHKWKRTLSPGSLFELSLTQHLGKGINLNQFIIEEEQGTQFTSVESFSSISKSCLLDNSLMVILNYGEKNCRLIDKSQQLPRNGYSTSSINFEFKTNYKYLGEGNYYEKPCNYKEKRKCDQFESSELKELNQMQEASKFNIDYENIGSSEDQEFYLERAEQIDAMSTSSLDKLKEIYESAKIEEVDQLSEDDHIFANNLTNATDELDSEDLDEFFD